MKAFLRFFLVISAASIFTVVNAQTDGVLIDYTGSTRDNSAVLDVRSNNQGFLVPRISIPNLNSASPVTSPAIGLLVYNTSVATGVGFYYWNGSTWLRITNTSDNLSAGNQLSLSGNTLNVIEGSGSGLDADLLDGQNGSYYLDNTDTQTLSVSGGNLTISGGNSVSLSSLGDNLGNHSATTALDMNSNAINEVVQVNTGSDHLEFMRNRADDTSYEWMGFYSGSTRQGIILYDGSWSGANSSTDEFSITAEAGNKLTLNTDGDDIALMPDGSGNVGINTMDPLGKLHVRGGKTFMNQLGTNPQTSNYANADLVIGDNTSTRNGYGGTNGSHIFLQSSAKSSITALDESNNLGQISYENLRWTLGENIGWGNQNIRMPILAGAGTRAVVADANGDLSTQAITSGTVTSIATGGNGITGGTITTSGTISLDYGSSSTGGPRPVGNFGQFLPHGTTGDFNSNPTHWGWNYVQGNTNAPNTSSSQWYRGVFSLGDAYPARGGGGYSMELAYPRYNHANAGVWMRTIENGTIGGWTRIDANGITGDNLGNHTATTTIDMAINTVDNINSLDMEPGNGRGLRFWSSDSYKISMGNAAEYKYGPVTDYSIKMNMNNDATRGWTWGVSGSVPVAAINTEGILQVANDIRIDGNTVIDDGGGWHRSYGNTGLYNGTYGGGIYMTDATYVRTYNGKPLRSNGLLFEDAYDLRTAGDGVIFRHSGQAAMAFDDWLDFYDSNTGTLGIRFNIDQNDFYGDVHVDDTRDINDPPTTYNNEVTFDFKRRSAIGVPGSGTYSGNMTFAPWGDDSGDASHQLNFNEGGLFWRQGQPNSGSWDSWNEIIHSGNISSYGDNLGNHIATTDLKVAGSSGHSIYTWSNTDANWRIGMSNLNTEVGFSRSLATSHVQYATFWSGGGQGFAVGDASTGLSSFEVTGSGSGYDAFFRGDVGIGGNPSYPLHITKTNSGNWQGRFTNGGSNVYLAHQSGYGIHINTGGSNSSGRYAFEARNANQTHFYVRDDGATQIGDSSPFGDRGDLTLGASNGTDGQLYLYGSTAGKYSIIRTSNGNLHIDAGYGSGGGNGIYLGWYSAGDLYYGAGGGSEVFRVQTDGDVRLNNKHAFQATDSWLRLNQDGAFSSGTYTPGHFRSDGGITSGGSTSPGAGNIRATGLAGTGNRPVYADANGTLTTTNGNSNTAWTMSANIASSPDDFTGYTDLTNDGEDDVTRQYNLGFTVTIDGTNYTNISVCSNGWIAFGTVTSTTYSNTSLPASFTSNPVIFPYWDDMKDYGGGEWSRAATYGSSPNRVCIIDVSNRDLNGSVERVNYQVQIHEGSGLINVKYRNEMSPSMNGQSATIGFQGSGGSSATAYPIVYNGKVLDDNRDDTEGWSVCPVR